MATLTTAMLFGDDEVNQAIGARVENQNLIFYFTNEEGEEDPSEMSYTQQIRKEYNRAKVLGFKGTITDYMQVRDYT